MHASLLWIFVAQSQMADSWRIGIDQENETPLITKGLFSLSRNPIFLGILVADLGLFLVIPNALTLLIVVWVFHAIQIQVRLEEEFLIQTHNETYLPIFKTGKTMDITYYDKFSRVYDILSPRIYYHKARSHAIRQLELKPDQTRLKCSVWDWDKILNIFKPISRIQAWLLALISHSGMLEKAQAKVQKHNWKNIQTD